MSVLVSTVFDYGDVFCKSSLSTHKGFPPVRKTIGSPVNIPSQRRNSSSSITIPSSPPSPKSPLVLHSTTNGLAFSLTPQTNSNISSREHPKLDRSLSEPVEPSRGSSGNSSSGTQQQPRQSQPNSSRYKTELCRPFEENGTCKYGDKCQFAHGIQELRTLVRHPKYKTELCRTYHSTGFCPYGPRCHFIHNSEESRKNLLNHLQAGLQAIGRQDTSTANTHASVGSARPKALSIGSFSLGSAGDLSPPSSVSGSPTSLNSFFSEDPFAAGYTTNHSAALPAKTAFSFSHDFATLVNSMKHHPQSGIHLPTFGGSQPTLTQYELSAALASLPSNTGELYVESTYPDAYPDANLAGFEPSPPSPVESLSSELECLNVTTNPEPPVCTSPSEISRSPPRLPIFSRLANSDMD